MVTPYPVSVADPDLQIRGGGSHPDPEMRCGGEVSKIYFLALWASVWSKNGGWGPLLDLPLCLFKSTLNGLNGQSMDNVRSKVGFV